MPKHYGDKKSKPKGKGKAKTPTMKNMTEAQHKSFLKAEKEGLITKKQHEKLPPHLLEAIIKKKRSMK